MAWYFECPIQCFSAAFDVLIKISEVIDLRTHQPYDIAAKGATWHTNGACLGPYMRSDVLSLLLPNEPNR